MATIEKEKEYIITKRIEKATFYSAAAREYDDRLALQKLKRYQDKIRKEKNIVEKEEKPSLLAQLFSNFDSPKTASLNE